MAKAPTNTTNKTYVIKKSGGHGDGHHGGAWKIALADFYTTLSMVFFVLWVAGILPEEKLAGVSQSFQQVEKQEFNAIKLDVKGKELSDTDTGTTEVENSQDTDKKDKEQEKTQDKSEKVEASKATIIDVFNQLQQELDQSVAQVVLAKNEESIEIQFVADLLFKSASAELSPRSRGNIDKVGNILNGKGLFTHIYGFADNRQMRPNAKYRDNLSLSAARALSVVENINVKQYKDIAITMHAEGELNPIADNTTRVGRKKNRRVEMYITLSSTPPREFAQREKNI